MTEYYNNLNEKLKLNYHVSIRNIRGEKDDEISACYGEKCKNIPDSHQRKLCKEQCHQAFIQNAIGKLSSLVGKCQYSDHPSVCRRAVARMIRIYRDRIQTSKNRVRDIKSEIIAKQALKRGK